MGTLYITGAGVSSDSGIPTFRGADGFWTIGSEFYELTTEEGVLIHTNTDFGYEESTMISTKYLSLNNILNSSLTLFPNPAVNFIQIKYDLKIYKTIINKCNFSTIISCF